MSRYGFDESIRDGATLPLHFESRLVELHIDKEAIDQAYKELTGGLSDLDKDNLARAASKMAVLVKVPERIRNTMATGAEWLGEAHPAVQCLQYGIALHHGGLPRPFLNDVERLLRSGDCPLTIASPTLAQGLNLSRVSQKRIEEKRWFYIRFRDALKGALSSMRAKASTRAKASI